MVMINNEIQFAPEKAEPSPLWAAQKEASNKMLNESMAESKLGAKTQDRPASPLTSGEKHFVEFSALTLAGGYTAGGAVSMGERALDGVAGSLNRALGAMGGSLSHGEAISREAEPATKTILNAGKEGGALGLLAAGTAVLAVGAYELYEHRNDPKPLEKHK